MLKNIFFDLDNTLWDFKKNSYCALEKLYAEQDIENKYHISFEEFYPIYSENNETLWAEFRDHKIDADFLKQQRFIQTFAHFGVNDDKLSEFFYDNYLKTITEFNYLVPGSLEILEYLEPKYNLHILTNGFEEVTHRKVNNSALKGHFKTITSAEEIQKRKPQAEIFQYALDKANATKENTAFIGDDWLADALGARDFGIKSIFYDALNENLSGEGIIVIKDFNELKNIL